MMKRRIVLQVLYAIERSEKHQSTLANGWMCSSTVAARVSAHQFTRR
jgi:hypothetical protein